MLLDDSKPHHANESHLCKHYLEKLNRTQVCHWSQLRHCLVEVSRNSRNGTRVDRTIHVGRNLLGPSLYRNQTKTNHLYLLAEDLGEWSNLFIVFGIRTSFENALSISDFNVLVLTICISLLISFDWATAISINLHSYIHSVFGIRTSFEMAIYNKLFLVQFSLIRKTQVLPITQGNWDIPMMADYKQSPRLWGENLALNLKFGNQPGNEMSKFPNL